MGDLSHPVVGSLPHHPGTQADKSEKHLYQKGSAMLSFMLETAFTQQDLDRIFASGSNVVVAKPNNGGAPNVAWIVYRPLLDNAIEWEEQYGIYASNADVVNGAVLSQMSQTAIPAADNVVYPFTGAGYFGPAESGGVSGSFTARNDYDNLPKGYLTMGLFQKATVNGSTGPANAVSAAPVIFRSKAQMTPFTTVYLWIQSQVRSNSVITNVTSPQTRVTFGGDVTQVSLRYNANTGTFLSAGTLPGDVQLDHIVPTLL